VKKPSTADQYAPEQLRAVRAVCFDLASALGDLRDELVIVGGLVPSLLIGPHHVGGEAHVGTLDLDVGLQVGLSDRARYHRLVRSLRDSGFAPATTGRDGETTRYRWVSVTHGSLVDFLIPPRQPEARKGDLVTVDQDLQAVVTPGLRLAFRDREVVRVDRWWSGDKKAAQRVQVCGPGAFAALKALAFRDRHENKDAYDLHYLIRHYGTEVEDVSRRLGPLLDDPDAQAAVTCLREDFANLDSPGPRAVAAFLLRRDDDGFKADVAGLVARLIGGL
jgi:hypothetical protein